MPAWLAEFHFLRPEWLLALVPAALVAWLIERGDDPLRPFKGLIAPHLLPHLVVGEGKGGLLRPAHAAAAFLIAAILAVAGPTWQREAPPFAQEKAGLVVAVDLSRGMDAIDVQPTRLERAKQKVRDLLALREGARTALVAYAGTAHTVLPLTDDADILTTYLEALETRIMPAAGQDAKAALALAESLLAKEQVPGTILFLTDGIPAAQAPAFEEHQRSSRNQVVALGVGTVEGGPIREGRDFATEGGHRVVAKLDRDGLLALGREAGVLVGTVTLDDRDVKWIAHGIQSHMESVVKQDANARYRDFGWYAAPALALVAGLWFRRGWTLRWAAILAVVLFPAPADAADFRLVDLFATRDQQGRYYFSRGDYRQAADRFVDPMWKGTACYRAADYACAVDAFARVDTPEAWYDLGNAYARQGELKLAVSAYDKALATRPGWDDAKANRDRVAALIPKPKKDDEEEGQADPNQPPDQVKFDDKGKKGKLGKVNVQQLTDEQIAQIWLRGVQTSPTEFLRMKFADQASAGRRAGSARAGGAP